MHDLIMTGGQVVTMEPGAPRCEAVGVRGGRIAAAGSLRQVKSAMAPDAAIADLAGACLLPGFVEPHSHVLWAAKTRGAPVVDIRPQTVPTYAAAIAKIKRRVAAGQPGEHLLFFGLDAQLHPDMEAPGRGFLDEIAPRSPIGIQTSNCHAVFLNSLGLEAAGIDLDQPDTRDGMVEVDAVGRPTGRVVEAACWDALDAFYTAWGKLRLTQGFERSIHSFIEQGITTATEHLYLPHYKAYYANALEQGVAVPRVAAYQQVTSADACIDSVSLADNRLWLAGVKIHADGSPFVGNIWVSEPYLETSITLERMQLSPGHTGSINYPQDTLRQMIKAYFDAGWQMSVHTQGDRTIDLVLDIVQKLLASKPRADHRFRLEHCALMRPDQVERANTLGVLSSFFVSHIRHWGAPIEDALFGPARAARYMPVRSASDTGMRISLHADTPMTDPSALLLMQTAINRLTTDGRCIGPDERIDAPTALAAVTIDAAYQLRMEDKLGSIAPGKYADFAVLDGDPLDVDTSSLHEIEVVETWLGGECVYRR